MGTRKFPQRGKEGFVAGTTEEKQIRRGNKIKARYVRALVKHLTASASLPEWVHPHTLRHSAAQRLFDSTGNIEIVRKFLGHKAVTTTQVYAEANDKDVQKAVEALGMPAEQAAEHDEVQRLAKALAELSEKKRKILAAALGAS